MKALKKKAKKLEVKGIRHDHPIRAPMDELRTKSISRNPKGKPGGDIVGLLKPETRGFGPEKFKAPKWVDVGPDNDHYRKEGIVSKALRSLGVSMPGA